MNELLRIGVSPDSIAFSAKAEDALVSSYQEQITAAVLAAYEPFWPSRITDAVKRSDLFSHIATVTADVTRILRMETPPKLGLLNGFLHGIPNCNGFCWEEEGDVWVGIEELWIGTIGESIAEMGGLDPLLRRSISFTVAEEVFHAFIRQTNPAVAEENIKANSSGDAERYWNSVGERAAKAFASVYLSQLKE